MTLLCLLSVLPVLIVLVCGLPVRYSVQFNLNPRAPSFVTTFEPSPASLTRSRNHNLCSSAVACPEVMESSPPESSLVEHQMSLFSPIEDHDEDVTLLKSHFDPGGPELPVQVRKQVGERSVLTPTVEGLPEHVTQLFLDTFQEDDFPIEATHGLKQLLIDHQHTFATSSANIGYCSILQHDIDTGDAHPIRQAPRKPPLAARKAEDEILNEMLKTGVIEPSMSSWASPVCLVRKKDNTFRFCIDYRRVNAVSKKDAYPIPDIQDALDNLRGAKYFATFDLLSGYWQLGLIERAKERSAFCTRRGLFHFTRMPFALTGAPSTFCRLMSIVLREYLWEICLCYLDDIIIFGRTPQELLDRMRTILDKLREVGLKVKPSKCILFKTEIQYLGHLVSEAGINPMPDKIQALKAGLLQTV